MRMRFGVTIFATDQTMSVDDVAVEAEARGFGSLYLPEHTHIPTSRVTPPPIGGGELPEEYRRTVDPLVALAAAAARTSTITLGTGVLLPAQREPIVTAKALATLQNLSGGRFVLGVGYGWNVDEMENHGVEYGQRRDLAREVVLAMQRLWSDDVASFNGDQVTITPSWSWPKPDPMIPVLVGGGAGPKLFGHIAEFGEGWIPIGGSGLAESIPMFHQTMEAAGRDPSTMEIVPFGSLPTPGKLAHFEKIGVTEVVMRLSSAGPDTVLTELDHHAATVAEYQAT